MEDGNLIDIRLINTMINKLVELIEKDPKHSKYNKYDVISRITTLKEAINDR